MATRTRIRASRPAERRASCPGIEKATSLGSKSNGSSRVVSTVTSTQPIAGVPCTSILVIPPTGWPSVPMNSVTR